MEVEIFLKVKFLNLDNMYGVYKFICYNWVCLNLNESQVFVILILWLFGLIEINEGNVQIINFEDYFYYDIYCGKKFILLNFLCLVL